jgi:hypothetical protein
MPLAEVNQTKSFATKRVITFLIQSAIVGILSASVIAKPLSVAGHRVVVSPESKIEGGRTVLRIHEPLLGLWL